MHQRQSDEPIVIVKVLADEEAVMFVEDKTNDQVARKPEVKGGTCKRSLETMSNTASEFSLKGTLNYQYVHSGI